MITIDYLDANDQPKKRYTGIGNVDLMHWYEWFQPSQEMDVHQWQVYLQDLLQNGGLAYLCHIISFYVNEVNEQGISDFKDIHGKGIAEVMENHFDNIQEFVNQWFDGTVLFRGLNLGEGIESDIVDEVFDEKENTVSVIFRNGDKLLVTQNDDKEDWKQFYVPTEYLPKLKGDITTVLGCFSAV